MSGQMESFALPAGRYPGQVKSVELLEPARHYPWRLKIVAVVQRNGREVNVWRELAPASEADPYALSAYTRKGLREFAGRLGLQDEGPVEETVAAIRSMVDRTVTVHARSSPVGLAIRLYANGSEPTLDDKAQAGVVLEATPPVEPEYTERTLDAQGAHEQLLTGLGHAHRGLALAAEACFQLRRDEGWVALGYDSIGLYLASPEVAMSRSQFYSLADIWEYYVQEGGLDERRLCAPSKLEVPLPALKAGEVTAEEAASDAEALGLRDLRVKYRGEKDPTGEPPADPPAVAEFPFACRACGTVIPDKQGIVAMDDREARA